MKHLIAVFTNMSTVGLEIEYYTIMDFSGVIHDVIFAVKIIIDRGVSRGQ